MKDLIIERSAETFIFCSEGWLSIPNASTLAPEFYFQIISFPFRDS